MYIVIPKTKSIFVNKLESIKTSLEHIQETGIKSHVANSVKWDKVYNQLKSVTEENDEKEEGLSNLRKLINSYKSKQNNNSILKILQDYNDKQKSMQVLSDFEQHLNKNINHTEVDPDVVTIHSKLFILKLFVIF